MSPSLLSCTRRRSRAAQRGVVLLLSLIALGIVLILAATLVRSFQSSMFTAGNIGFKRDMQNQSELAADQVLPVFRNGLLSTSAQRAATTGSLNYSAQMLATNSRGIPTALFASDSTFGASWTAADLTIPNNGGTIRYLVDRMCSTTGNEATLSSASCQLAADTMPKGADSTNQIGPDRQSACPTCVSATPQNIVYRLSIRVTGPRGTQSFFQTTFTVPTT